MLCPWGIIQKISRKFDHRLAHNEVTLTKNLVFVKNHLIREVDIYVNSRITIQLVSLHSFAIVFSIQPVYNLDRLVGDIA